MDCSSVLAMSFPANVCRELYIQPLSLFPFPPEQLILSSPSLDASKCVLFTHMRLPNSLCNFSVLRPEEAGMA